MAKTNRPRKRMDRYFKNLQKNSYILSYNQSTSKIKKWDVIRRLTKKLVGENGQTIRIHNESQSLDPGVQLLPRQDVMLYGTIPAMEQRVYRRCKNCTRVFNPRDILSHTSCSEAIVSHSSLLKSVNNKKTSSNGTSSSNSTNGNGSVIATSSTPAVQDRIKDFEFKRPFTPPPKKTTLRNVPDSLPQLKVSVAKIGLAKTSESTSATSSNKLDSKFSSSEVTSTVHHILNSPSSGHYTSKPSSGHSLRDSSSSSLPIHHGFKNSLSGNHSNRSSSSSSHHKSISPSSVHFASKSSSKSGSIHHESSHHSGSTGHHSRYSSSSKSTPMDTLPDSSTSSRHHHSMSSSSSGTMTTSSSSTKTLPKNYNADIPCEVVWENSESPVNPITCSEFDADLLLPDTTTIHSTKVARKRHGKSRDSCLTKTNRPRRRIDCFFKNLQINTYIFSTNKKGSCITKTKKWDLIRRITKKLLMEDERPSKAPKEFQNADAGVQLLPRQDVTLYGTIPAMEQKLYSRCKNCSRIFNPRDVLSHKDCVEIQIPHSTTSSATSISTTTSEESIEEVTFKRPFTPPPLKPSSASSPNPIPQAEASVTKIGLSRTTTTTSSSNSSDTKVSSSKVTSTTRHSLKSPTAAGYHSSKSSLGHSHRSSSSSHHGAKSSSSSHHRSGASSKSLSMDTLPSSSSSSHHHHSSSGSSHSSSRHKKSYSSSTKVLSKNYNPDIHCGVIEGNRRPCMRSITCSTHRLQLRKQVSGRSKDIHQLIEERKAAKENDLKHATPPFSYTSPNGEAKEVLRSNTIYVPAAGQVVGTSVDSSVLEQHPRNSSLLKKLNITETENKSVNGYLSRAENLENTQDKLVGTVPVMIMPVSPVSVVSSVQLLKIGNNIISLDTPQPVIKAPAKKLTILPMPSNHTNSIRMYRSLPKPVVFPEAFGGTIFFANSFEIQSLRNDLLATIDIKLEAVSIERGLSGLNHGHSPHRPNILKGKGGIKTNCKRAASDKLTTSDNKRPIPDVNGFILHAGVSETADAPQYSGENGPSQHKLVISLIDKYGY